VRDLRSSSFVDLYGSLALHPYFDPDTHEEDLYSLLVARADLMAWSSCRLPHRSEFQLWGMNEAELGSLASDSEPVAWFQVTPLGSDDGSVPLIPALVRCAGDVVNRIGEFSLSALQVSHKAQGVGLEVVSELVGALGWFNASDPRSSVPVRVTISGSDQPHRVALELQDGLERLNTGRFVFESATRDQKQIVLHAVVPEWSLDALAWTIAVVHGAWVWIEAPPAPLVVRVDRR
jgi:hypothetical protein